jgi:hypothetical protein
MFSAGIGGVALLAGILVSTWLNSPLVGLFLMLFAALVGMMALLLGGFLTGMLLIVGHWFPSSSKLAILIDDWLDGKA